MCAKEEEEEENFTYHILTRKDVNDELWFKTSSIFLNYSKEDKEDKQEQKSYVMDVSTLEENERGPSRA